MAENIEEDAIVTDTIDRMIQAILDQLHLNGEDRLKVQIALCEAIAEAYSEKAQLLRLLLNEPSASAEGTQHGIFNRRPGQVLAS